VKLAIEEDLDAGDDQQKMKWQFLKSLSNPFEQSHELNVGLLRTKHQKHLISGHQSHLGYQELPASLAVVV
jgi:hypothetical protein